MLRLFNGGAFSTLQFIERYREQFPAEWAQIEQQHGSGGKGAKTRYSAYSRMAHHLNRFANEGLLHKHEYQTAPAEWGSARIRYWGEYREEELVEAYLGETMDEPITVTEGQPTKTEGTRYQRSAKARDICIDKWGVKCEVCAFDFEAVFGALGAGYIHVHHLKPIADYGQSYQLVPINDLRPLCPNCHAMAHRQRPVKSIQELKEIRARRLKQ